MLTGWRHDICGGSISSKFLHKPIVTCGVCVWRCSGVYFLRAPHQSPHTTEVHTPQKCCGLCGCAAPPPARWLTGIAAVPHSRTRGTPIHKHRRCPPPSQPRASSHISPPREPSETMLRERVHVAQHQSPPDRLRGAVRTSALAHRTLGAPTHQRSRATPHCDTTHANLHTTHRAHQAGDMWCKLTQRVRRPPPPPFLPFAGSD